MKTITDMIEDLGYELDRVKGCANAPRETQLKILDEGQVYASLAKQIINAHDMTIRYHGLAEKGILDKDILKKYIG